VRRPGKRSTSSVILARNSGFVGIGFTSIDHAVANGCDSRSLIATGSFDDALTATARKEIRMKVFIIGIGGGVGRRVAQQLIELGHQVDGFVRQLEKGGDLAKSGISTTPGDIVKMSVSQITSAVSGSDAIVFSAGAGGRDGAEATTQVDGDGPSKLAAAAKEANVKRFVLVSVFPEAWRERQMPKDFELYMIEKKKAESKLVLTDRDWIIIRPSALTNKTGQGEVDLGLAKIHVEIARDDVASTIVEVLGQPGISRVILEVTAGTTPIANAVAAMLPK
jgi:nucleoside-diphosphate-sugar epimerase